MEDASSVPTQKGFIRMYDSDFWCRWNPMDWCYGDAVYNDDRRDITPSFQEFCENMLLREELEYQAAIMLTLICIGLNINEMLQWMPRMLFAPWLILSSLYFNLPWYFNLCGASMYA